MRSTYSLWRFAESVQIASGEVTANENGEFTIPVRLQESDSYKNDDKVYYRYSIEATVTNVAGETQSSTDVISAGNRSLFCRWNCMIRLVRINHSTRCLTCKTRMDNLWK